MAKKFYEGAFIEMSSFLFFICVSKSRKDNIKPNISDTRQKIFSDPALNCSDVFENF
jgi:hypothetical protein